MEQNTNYPKVIKLIQEKQFESAIQELVNLNLSLDHLTPWGLIYVYCLIEAAQYQAAQSHINAWLKMQPDHELLQKVAVYLLDLSHQNTQEENPLKNASTVFLNYFSSGISALNTEQWNQFMHQVLTKPYLK